MVSSSTTAARTDDVNANLDQSFVSMGEETDDAVSYQQMLLPVRLQSIVHDTAIDWCLDASMSPDDSLLGWFWK
jgi:hypothetical protein